jgi:hypothetical protein
MSHFGGSDQPDGVLPEDGTVQETPKSVIAHPVESADLSVFDAFEDWNDWP